MTSCQNCRYKKPLQGMIESMQQSSATPKNRNVGRGLRKIVACSQPYLAVASCIYSFWHGVIPTSYFYTCFTHFSLTVSISTNRGLPNPSQSRLLKGTNCLFALKDHVRPVSKRLCIIFMALEEEEKDGENRGFSVFRI